MLGIVGFTLAIFCLIQASLSIPENKYESSNCFGVSILNLNICQKIVIDSTKSSIRTTLRVFKAEIPLLSKNFDLYSTTDYTYCLTIPDIPLIGDFATCMYLAESSALSKDLEKISPLEHNLYKYRVHADAYFNETLTLKKSYKSDSIDVTLISPEAFTGLFIKYDRTKVAIDGSVHYGTNEKFVINKIEFKNVAGKSVPSPFYDYTPEPTNNVGDRKIEFSFICDEPSVPTQKFTVMESRLLDSAQNGNLGIIIPFPENVTTHTTCAVAYNGSSKFCDGDVCNFVTDAKYTFVKDSISKVTVKIIEESVTKNEDPVTQLGTPYIVRPGQKGPIVFPHAEMKQGSTLGPDVSVDYKVVCDNKIIYEEKDVYGFETPWAAPSANNLGGLIAIRPANCYVEMWYAFPVWLDKQKVISEFFTYDVYPEAIDMTYSWSTESGSNASEVETILTDDVATISVNVFTNFGSLVPNIPVTLDAQCVSKNSAGHKPTGQYYTRRYNLVSGGSEIDVEQPNYLTDMLKFNPLTEFPVLFNLTTMKSENNAAYKDAMKNGVYVSCTFIAKYGGSNEIIASRSYLFNIQNVEVADFDLHRVSSYITYLNPLIPVWQRVKVSQYSKDTKHAFTTAYELDCPTINYKKKLTVDESRTYAGANGPQSVEKLNQSMLYLIAPNDLFTAFDSSLHSMVSCAIKGYLSSASIKNFPVSYTVMVGLKVVHKNITSTFYDNEVSTLKDVWVLPRGSDTVDEASKDGSVKFNEVDEGYGFGDEMLIYPSWADRSDPSNPTTGNLFNTLDIGIICSYYDPSNTKALLDDYNGEYSDDINAIIGVQDEIRRDQGFIPNTMQRWGTAEARLNTDGSDYMVVNTNYHTEKIHSFYAPSETGVHTFNFDTTVTTADIGIAFDHHLYAGCGAKECKPSTSGRCHWTQSRHINVSPYVEAGKVYPNRWFGDIGCCSVRNPTGYPAIDHHDGAGSRYYPNELGFYDFFASGSNNWVNGEVIVRKFSAKNAQVNKVTPFSTSSGWGSDEQASNSKNASPVSKGKAHKGTCFVIPASTAESAFNDIESLRNQNRANNRSYNIIDTFYSHEPMYINMRSARHSSHIVLNSESVHYHTAAALQTDNLKDYEPSPDGHDSYILADNPLSFSVFSYDPATNELFMIDNKTTENDYVIGVDADRSKFVCLAQVNSKYNFEKKLVDAIETNYNNVDSSSYVLGTTPSGRTFFRTNATMQLAKPRIDKDSFICELDIELVVLNGLMPVAVDLDNLHVSWHLEGLEIYETYYGVKAEIKTQGIGAKKTHQIKALPLMYNESLNLYNLINVNTTTEFAHAYLGDCKATTEEGTFVFHEEEAKLKPIMIPYYFWNTIDIENNTEIVIPTNRTSDVVCTLKILKKGTKKVNDVLVDGTTNSYTITYKKDTEPTSDPTDE